MIKTHINHESIINEDRSLQKWLSNDQLDFEQEIIHARPDMLNDLKHRKDLNLRLLNKPLLLEEVSQRNTAFDGTVSKEDYINRARLIIETEIINGDSLFQLKGSDDANADLSDWYSIGIQLVISETGTFIHDFWTYFKFYRLEKISANDTTYGANLFETVYDFLHLYKTIERIYRQLNKLNDDAFMMKQDLYKDKYEQLLINGRFFYDQDDSGEYDYEERKSDVNIIRVGRG